MNNDLNKIDKINIIDNRDTDNDFALKQFNIEMRNIEKLHSCFTVCTYIYWYALIGSILSIFIGWWPIVLIARANIKKSTKINLLILSCISLIPLISAIFLFFMMLVEQNRLRTIRKSNTFSNALPSMAK